MKTKITLHRPGQIGGCVTEIFTGRTRILIDYGEELPGSPNKEPFEFPWDKSQYEHPEQHPNAPRNGRRVDAVFFTHYHGDHIGRIRDIPEKVPVYMSALTKRVLGKIHTYLKNAAEKRAVWDKSSKTADWLKREDQIVEALGRARLFEPGEGRMMQPVLIGEDITVTPCRVDHSAAEACMFLIETPDKCILHTGDFRGHGFGAGTEGTAVLEDVERFAGQRKSEAKRIDTLIIEGTMMSRTDEQPYSEADLREAADALFAEHRHVFLIVSSTNFDSIRTFYEAASAKKIPFYGGSGYIASQLETLGEYAGIPALAQTEAADPDNAGQMARMRKDGFVVIVKGSARSSGRLVSALKGCAPVIVYSMWMGYLTRGLDPDLSGFMQFCRARGLEVIPPPDGSPGPLPLMHTSGHASPDLLAGVIKAADPGEIWPIHTENAAGFLQLKLDPPDLKDRIRLGDYRREKDHRALSTPALAKFLPSEKPGEKPDGKLCNFVQLVNARPELAFCLRGNSGNEAVIYYKNHTAFIISSEGHVRFNFDHARFLEDADWLQARQRLAGLGYSFEGKPETKPKEGEEPVGMVSMPPEKAEKLGEDELKELTVCIERIINSFFEGKEREGKPLIEKEVQQKLFLACKAQKDGYFFYDMEFSQPWGKLLGCKNQPDMLAVRFGPNGEPERLVFVEVKSTPQALKGGSGLASHIRGMENYPDWLLPVRGLDACRILEQYIALGLAEGPAGQYEAQREQFQALPMEVLLVFTGPDAAGKDAAKEDTLAKLDKMTKDDPALLQGYEDVTGGSGPFAAALKQREKPAALRVYRKEL